MDAVLWTGNNTARTISGLNFSPDLVWIKNRSTAQSHTLYDTIRGATKALIPNGTDSELTLTDFLTAFTSDGFSIGTDNNPNGSGNGVVGWAWDAGTSTVTNTAGSITSQVRANASAGFSVVTYTGTGSAATVGHGLGVAPSLLICKGRQESGSNGNWLVYHSSLGNTKYLILNATDAQGTSSGAWNNTSPTSTTFSIGTFTGANSTGGNICYAFAPVSGYSSFGSYVGNGSSSDGPFVYTGFRPKWLLVKETTNSNNWFLLDATRSPYNYVGDTLWPNLSNQENDTSINPNTTYNNFDFLSNGFKPRSVYSGTNRSAGTYIYAAFAESPFQYARAR
jgi:hypothetical protein